MSEAGYVLYWDYLTSAIAPHVMLVELGAQFEMVRIDTDGNEHKQPAYLQINPNGLMPALRLPDGTTFGETAAILLTLGERHPEAKLVPAIEEHDRTNFLQWLIAIATTGHTTLRRHSYPDLYTTRHDALEGTREVSGEQLDYFFGVLETAIEGSPFFLSRGFGPLDIYLAMLLRFFDGRDALFEKRPLIGKLYDASVNRTSFRTVFDLHFKEE